MLRTPTADGEHDVTERDDHDHLAAMPVAGIERDRAFSSLHARMFGVAESVTVGRFVILRKLGAGAMGAVFAAYDPQLDRKVALKVLTRSSTDDVGEARLHREARALARLRHANVVAVHEVGSHGGERFIAMDLVEGETLREWLATPRPWRAIVDVFIEAGHGLIAAHDAGLVHRDFKPDNVLVEHGHARVVDFGLSRPGGFASSAGDTGGPARDGITNTGAVVGTPAYMAPEAFDGDANEACDQYSYCASLYEAIHGVRPFGGATIEALRVAVLERRWARPVAGRRTPAWLRRAITRGLAAEPGERWPDMRALLRELERHRRTPFATVAISTGIAGSLAGAAAVAMWSTPMDRCAADPRLTAIWNPARADAIAEAFAATGLPFADDGWRRAQPILERYADEWHRMQQQACSATYRSQESSEAMFDLRMQCLDRRLDELSATLDRFEAADRGVVANAVPASLGLGSIAPCGDLEALARQPSDRGPAPPALLARLARVHSARRTGAYVEALDEARAVASEADDARRPDVAAEAYWLAGVLEQRVGDEPAAERDVRVAIERAEEAADDAMRAQAQTSLVSLLAGRHAIDAAQQWVGLTRATLSRLGEPPRLRAALAATEGDAFYAAGEYARALELRREALELKQEYLDEVDPELAAAHSALGAALAEVGRLEEAREEHAFALAMRVRALGEQHPDVARGHNHLAAVLMLQGDLEGAIAEAQQAIDLGSIAFGPDDDFVGSALVNLASAIAQGPDAMASVPYFERAVAIFEKSPSADGAALSVVLGNLGRVLAHSTTPSRAIEVLTRARALQLAQLGPEHSDLVYTENNLATAYLRTDRLADARVSADRAADLARRTLPPDHPMLAVALRTVGGVARAQGDLVAARTILEEAAALLERTEHRSAQLGEVRFDLAKVFDALGDPARARALAKTARDDVASDGPQHFVYLAEIDAWLAAHGP
jgi:tetratricopeptide (TPR) repeat protein